MLDRTLLMQELQKKAKALFYHPADQLIIATQLWQLVAAQPSYARMLQASANSLMIPTWQDALGACYAVPATTDPYYLVSIDGSQIYPDRHQGINCFLINIGITTFDYGHGSFKGDSIPYLFAAQEYDQGPELVDYLRNDYERYSLFDCPLPPERACMLLDGALLQYDMGKENELGQFFAQRYTAFLYSLYQRHILAAWYISAPRHKEVMRLLYAHLAGEEHDKKKYQIIDQVTDAMLMSTLLKPYEHSPIFFYQNAQLAAIPAAAHPAFFYLHVGSEIVRVELPLYAATNQAYRSFIVSVLHDQVAKGHGYPIALAEAHEQAVVDTHDRHFFYTMLDMIAAQYATCLTVSPKQYKKRVVAI